MKLKDLYKSNITFTCPYCLKKFPLSEATIEHEPPKSRQKDLGKSSKTLSCTKCNNQKGALTAEEYELWKLLNEIRVHGI